MEIKGQLFQMSIQERNICQQRKHENKMSPGGKSNNMQITDGQVE